MTHHPSDGKVNIGCGDKGQTAEGMFALGKMNEQEVMIDCDFQRDPVCIRASSK